MKPFDLKNCPLYGIHLIEASAGTGKTYTLTRLFLRLIIERNFSGEEILVVTFTEAATEELKARLRNTIRDTIKAIKSGREHEEDDPLIKAYLQRADLTASQMPIDMLTRTLRAFDEVSIFTIHGFCRRMLKDNAFESGSLFDTDLITDQSSLVQEVVDDFWRKHVYQASPVFIDFLESQNITPDNLSQLLSVFLRHPDVRVIPESKEFNDLHHEEKRFRDAFMTLKKAWNQSKHEVEAIFYNHPGLNRKTYSEKSIPKWIDEMNRYLAMSSPGVQMFEGFDRFTSYKVQSSIKKNHKTPKHVIFTLCDTLAEAYSTLKQALMQNLVFLKAAVFDYAKSELPKKKQEKNIYFYDDLLLNLRTALSHEGKEGSLARQIRHQYKAALIDEFQDTDPIQWEIFKTVFAQKDRSLFLIGDPKQAIYGFRGADIFTYMDASRSAPSRYTMTTNYRSQANLIHAVNTLFNRVPEPFIFKEIPFIPVSAPEKATNESLVLRGADGSPMQIWALLHDDNDDPDKLIPKEVARNRIASAVAGEIEQLIASGQTGKAMVGSKPLRPLHIAVIVRTHREAELIQKYLLERNIPCVLDSQENIFDTLETTQIERILEAVVQPNQVELIRSALATTIIGFRAEALDEIFNDESQWEEVMVQFRKFRLLWERHGFMRFFRQMLSDFKIRQRLLGYKDGERRITNLLHIGEVLQQQSLEAHFGMTGLVKWLKIQRSNSMPRLDEHVIRLDRDDNAVRIVTMHKSKGLEFPVVFCPFAWTDNISGHSTTHTFHDPHGRLFLDAGSPEFESNGKIAAVESLAENMRLLYVALTRSKNRCYLVWGLINKTETSSLAYLFHHKGPLEKFFSQNILKTMDDASLMTQLKDCEKASDGTINVTVMPSHKGKSYMTSKEEGRHLECMTFSGTIRRDWHIRSFSSLVLNKPSESPDRDETSILEPIEDKEGVLEGIFEFPGGVKTGTLLHDIFENLDFTSSDHSDLVSKKLISYGFDSGQWTETICNMIRNVLNTPLKPGFITLSKVENRMRLSELEFYFPISSISPTQLRQIFKTYGGVNLPSGFPEKIGSLDFIPSRGFMKGFMDLVFCHGNRYYLIDWKSNFLGSTIDNYKRTALLKAMRDEFYILQYIIYTLALNEYLKLRFPGYNYETNFGGVFYIFLRGVNSECGSEYGIYSDKPEVKLIEALRDEIIL